MSLYVIAIYILADSNVGFGRAPRVEHYVTAIPLGEKDSCLILVLFLSCSSDIDSRYIHIQLMRDISEGTTAVVVSPDYILNNSHILQGRDWKL